MALGRLGITAETDVIAYADNASLYATRLWHVLRHPSKEKSVTSSPGPTMPGAFMQRTSTRPSTQRRWTL